MENVFADLMLKPERANDVHSFRLEKQKSFSTDAAWKRSENSVLFIAVLFNSLN